MPIIVGSRVVVGKHIWHVTKVEGEYCYMEWHGHSKVVACRAAEEYMTPGSPGRIRHKKPRVKDEVHQAFTECENPDDLIRVSTNHFKVVLDARQTRVMKGLPHYSMQRMYVARAIRTAIALKKKSV